MNLSRIIPQANQIRVNLHRHDSPTSPIETSNGIFYETHDLYGESSFEYYVALVRLFDKAMVRNNLHVLSSEQEQLLSLYFKEGNIITPEDDVDLEYYEYDFDLLSKQIYQLDEFLGSFLGVEDGEFARYGQEQFHSTRQPFSAKSEGIGGA